MFRRDFLFSPFESGEGFIGAVAFIDEDDTESLGEGHTGGVRILQEEISGLRLNSERVGEQKD